MLGRGEAGRRGGGAVLARIASIVRQVTGMPDYDRYVRHVRSCHPGMPILAQREYYVEYLRSRYDGGPTRCC